MNNHDFGPPFDRACIGASQVFRMALVGRKGEGQCHDRFDTQGLSKVGSSRSIWILAELLAPYYAVLSLLLDIVRRD